jgi:hypothetical protein
MNKNKIKHGRLVTESASTSTQDVMAINLYADKGVGVIGNNGKMKMYHQESNMEESRKVIKNLCDQLLLTNTGVSYVDNGQYGLVDIDAIENIRISEKGYVLANNTNDELLCKYTIEEYPDLKALYKELNKVLAKHCQGKTSRIDWDALRQPLQQKVADKPEAITPKKIAIPKPKANIPDSTAKSTV